MMTDQDEYDDIPETHIVCDTLSGAHVLAPDGSSTPLAEFRAQMAGQQVALPAHTVLAQPLSWMDGEPEALQQAIDNRQANRAKLLAWIKDALVEGTDYGRIHFVKKTDCKEGASCTNPKHFSKPSLWKAGAEKVAGMLGFRAVWPELTAELGHIKAGSKIVALRCQLIDQAGLVVSEGIGARSLDQDYQDVNKALKMAKKSGLIDAVLNAGGLSEIFTQDLSDDDDPGMNAAAPLDEDGQRYLLQVATDLFDKDQAPLILESLARHRFRLTDGDWRKIPAYRMQDAIRSLQEKEAEAADAEDFEPGSDSS